MHWDISVRDDLPAVYSHTYTLQVHTMNTTLAEPAVCKYELGQT